MKEYAILGKRGIKEYQASVLCLDNGPNSGANEPFTATPKSICERRFRACQHAVSSTEGTRTYAEAITAFGLFVVDLTNAQHCHYERIDSSGIAVRDAKRREGGWRASSG